MPQKLSKGPQTSFSAIESETPPEGSDKVTKLKSQVDEVKKIMTDNVEKVLQRGERLEDLMDKSEDLESNVSRSRFNDWKIDYLIDNYCWFYSPIHFVKILLD